MKGKQLVLVAIIFACALILPVTIYVGITSRKAISTYTPAWERVIFEAKEDAVQPGTFFDTDNPRFVVVDCGTDFDGRDCIVYADTVNEAKSKSKNHLETDADCLFAPTDVSRLDKNKVY